MKFFPPFFSKAFNMRWKDLNLVFDEIASFGFYASLKFFRFGDFDNFFQKNFEFFKANKLYIFIVIKYKMSYINR